MRNSDWSRDNNRSKKSTFIALGRLFKYMAKNYLILMIIVLFATFFSTFAAVQGAMFLQIVVDNFVLPALEIGAFDATGLMYEIFFMALIYAGGAFATFLLFFLMVRISGGVQRLIRNELFEKMQNLPIKYFDGQQHGDLMSKVTNDVDSMRGMLSQSLPEIIRALFTLIVTFIGMVVLSIPLTVIVVVAVVIQMYIAKFVTGKSKAGFISSARAMGKMNGYIEEMLAGQKVVKVFAREDKVKADFDVLNEELTDHLRTANKYSNILFPMLLAMGQALYGVIALVGGLLVLNPNSALTVGAVASFLYLSRTFVQPIGQISVQINSIIKALAASDRIFDTLDQEPEVDNGKIELEASDGHVVFKDVDFGYDEENLILRGISFEARPSSKVAIIGKTGAGKTTISNLVSRFYDVSAGNIVLDGYDIRDLTKASLRRSVGMVLQDTKLFTGTIADNIRYGRPDATLAEIKKAATLACANDFISRLPRGYDTVITDNGGDRKSVV